MGADWHEVYYTSDVLTGYVPYVFRFDNYLAWYSLMQAGVHGGFRVKGRLACQVLQTGVARLSVVALSNRKILENSVTGLWGFLYVQMDTAIVISDRQGFESVYKTF